MSKTMFVSAEERPLLQQADDTGTLDMEAADEISKKRALPKAQFAILCLLRTLDPMSFTQIFPYINQFVSDLHVTEDPSRIGLYSGLLESSFAFSQLIAVYPWGFISDRLGRRPVVLIGTLGLTVATILFGFSRSFWSALVIRALAGLFSGNVSVIPTILIDLTDQSNQAFAFSFFGFWWPVGAILGPLIGGLLSNPAEHYPQYFDHDFFRWYPYFLPSFVVGSFGLICFIVSAFSLEETLHQPAPLSYNSTTGNLPSLPNVPQKYNVKDLLEIRVIRALCASGCALSFISTAFDVLFVLFCFTPIHAGGLAFLAPKIGFALSISGFIAAMMQAFFMPTVLRRVNHATLYHFCMKIWPFSFILFPFLNIIARRGINSDTGTLDPCTTFVLWIGISLTLCMARVALLAYSVNMLLIKRFAPNSSSVGSTASLVQSFICFSRAFSPALASFIFASRRDFLAGYMWVVVMVLLSSGCTVFSRKIVEESRT